MKLIFPVIFFLIHGIVHSQVVKAPDQPAWLGLTASNKRLSDPFSVQLNPASPAFAVVPMVGVCSEIKYLQADLRFFYAAAVWPLSSGGVALNIGFKGTEGYSQSRIGLGYAKKLGEKLSIGMGFHYHRLQTNGYGSRSSLTAALGCQFIVSEKLAIYISADNPLGGMLGKSSDEKLASVYSAGIGNMLSEKVVVSATIRKEEDSPAVLFFMVNYRPAEQFTIYAGMSVGNSEGFLGSSIQLKNIELRQALGWKQGLGLSPSLSIIFQKKKTE